MGIEFQNMMELVVIQRLEELFSSDALECCKCEKCKMDIVSYALNRLPSKYVTTYTGEVYSKLESLRVQFDADIVAALAQGAEIVKKYPRHKPQQAE